MCIFNCGFPNDLLFGVYFVFILEYRNNVRQKTKFKQLVYLNSKWVTSRGDNFQHQHHIWPRNC